MSEELLVKPVKTLGELAAHERGQWRVDCARRSGIVRFQRVGSPTTLEDGTVLRDVTAGGLPLLRMQDGAEPPAGEVPRDDRGRLWIQFYALNPSEIVDHWLVGRFRVAWDGLDRTEFDRHPAMLDGHNPGRPVGRWDPERTVSNREGTTLNGFVSSAPGLPQEWQGLLMDGAAEGSAGIDIVEADWNEADRVLEIRKYTLVEGSLAGLPAVKSSFVRIAPLWARQAQQSEKKPPETPGGKSVAVPALDMGPLVDATLRARMALLRLRMNAAGGGREAAR